MYLWDLYNELRPQEGFRHIYCLRLNKGIGASGGGEVGKV